MSANPQADLEAALTAISSLLEVRERYHLASELTESRMGGGS
jgi:hypothetical protein